MRYDVVYIIRPNTNLLEFSASWSEEIISLLCSPRTWTKAEGGRTAWTAEDYTAQIKLLFLVWIKHYFLDGGTYDVSEKLKLLLGEPHYDLFTFDKWWTIERLDSFDSFEAILNSIDLGQFLSIGKTSMNRVDAWIARFKNKTHSEKE